MHDPGYWRERLLPFMDRCDAIATRQTLLTVVPLFMLWIGYAYLVDVSRWVVLPFSLLITLFILRSFVLMHDCGHGSLFYSKRANHAVGFIFGVITGMPQFVWSKNHTYHHNTNGDWVRYGGVFNILSTEEYAKLSPQQKRRYWLFRQPLILVPAGFFYVLFNPRFNWIAGTLGMFVRIAAAAARFRFSEAIDIAKKWEHKKWKGKKDYLHMLSNNVALLSIWFLMSKAIGAGNFFLLYIVSTSLAGSVGILLFTIQHNFEGSYATDTERVNHYRAAFEGTSMLLMPKFLNWFTADIAYHHVHHLSVAIPNYRLAACHKEYESLFKEIRHVRLHELFGTFNFQLWDPQLQKIVAKPN